jgi:hypothetical protein
MEGSCQSILQCRGIGGVPIGKCGLTNVCCVCKYLDTNAECWIKI